MRSALNLPEIAGLLAVKRLIVFDFDGVLADSVEVKTNAFATLYEPYGADVVAQVINHHRSHGGMSRYDKFRHYQREFVGKDTSEERVRQLAEKFSDIVKQAVIEAPEIPGARLLLENLNRDGKLCAVNSATPQQEMRDIIEQRSMAHLFGAVYGSPASKLENLNRLLDDFALSAVDALFFGDASSDLEAASAAGVEFVGVGETIGKILDHMGSTGLVIADFREVNVLLTGS